VRCLLLLFLVACGGAAGTPRTPQEEAACNGGPHAPGAPADAVVFFDPPQAAGAGKIARIGFQGLATVKVTDLRALVKSAPGTRPDPESIAGDVRRLWDLGAFEDVGVVTEPQPGGLDLVFQVREAHRVRDVFVRAAAPPQRYPLSRGAPFTSPVTYAAKSDLHEYYADRGHRDVEVKMQWARAAPGLVDVCFLVKEGPVVTVSKIDLVGVSPAHEPELRRRMKTAAGGIFRSQVLDEDITRLILFYDDKGMITTEVRAEEPAPRGEKLSVRVLIQEGPVFQIGTVAFAGLREEERYRELAPRPGDVFQRSKMLDAVGKMQRLHGDAIAGQMIVDTRASTVDLVFRSSITP
jgi:outer membrane protein insertion porin family